MDPTWSERATNIIQRTEKEPKKKIEDPILQAISDVERKLTSIGYVLITNPSLLLLDERLRSLAKDNKETDNNIGINIKYFN